MAQAPIHELLMRPLLPRLIAAIGVPATVVLLEKRGGAMLWVNRTVSDDDALVQDIGREAAQKFVDAFSGYERINLPKADKLLLAARNEAINAELDAHVPARSVARRYGLTVRQVMNVRREHRAAISHPSPQVSLF